MGNGRIVLPTDLRFRSSGGVSRSSSKGDGVGVNGKRRDALLYREYFSSSELNALCNYENRGCDRSITYKYVMSPFYDWLVEFLPLWLAPNVITLLGLITVVVPHVLLMLHAPTMSEEAPRWVYALNCVGLFAYMVLDNLDGRQARRTGSSSPLGHLVDHTCDALNVLITGLSVATTLRMGTTIYTLLLVWMFAMSVFVTSTIEEFYCGALILREINGANEGLLTMQGFYFFAALFGTDVWLTPIPIASWLTMPLGRCILLSVVLIAVPTIFASYFAVYKHGHAKNDNRLLQKSFRATIPFLLMSMFMFVWEMQSNVMEKYPLLFSWTCELTFTHIVSYMMIGHLCSRRSLPSFSLMVLPLGVGMVNALISNYIGDGLLELPLLFGITMVVAIVNMTTVYRISTQICDHLNISPFTVPKITK